MNNLDFSNAFGFREYNYSNSHHMNFPNGTRYNYVNYLIKGEAEIVGEDFSVSLQEGDLIYIPRGSRYQSHWYGNPNAVYRSFSFLYFPSENVTSYPIQKISANEMMIKYMEMLPIDNTINCFSLGTFFLFLDELFKHIKYFKEDKKLVLLDKALHYMRFLPTCTIPDVAKYCNISASALYMLFSKYMDCTPTEFKLNVKLENALHFLTSTDMPIEEISQRCGFSSSSYFRKNFIKKYNQSPRQIRKTFESLEKG